MSAMKLTRKYKEQVFETTAKSDLLLPSLTGLKIEECIQILYIERQLPQVMVALFVEELRLQNGTSPTLLYLAGIQCQNNLSGDPSEICIAYCTHIYMLGNTTLALLSTSLSECV